MPFPIQLLGGPADLLRIPGVRLRAPGVRTPNTFPGRPSMPRPLSGLPSNSSQPANGAAQNSTDDPGAPDSPPPSSYGPRPMGNLITKPNLGMTPDDPGAPEQQATISNGTTAPASPLAGLTTPNLPVSPPQPRGASKVVRNLLGGFLQMSPYAGQQQLGAEIRQPGLAKFNADTEQAMNQARLNQSIASTQEAQARTRLANAQADTLPDYRKQIEEDRQQAQQDRAQAGYERTISDITSPKVGGFEAPNVPPSVDRPETPADPSQPLSASNLPRRNLIFSPGLQPRQSARLGTLQDVTNPTDGTSTIYVRPNLLTRQEMQQAGWPTISPEQADALKDLGLEAGTPVDPKVFRQYNQIIQQRKAQQDKPAPTQRPLSVAPGHTVYDLATQKPIYTAPGKPEGDQKPPTRGQFAAIEARKQTALAKAESDARKRLRGSSTVEPEDPQTVYADLADQKQQIQNAYESEISALTGNDVQHFEYPAAGSGNAPSPAPSQPAAQPGGRTVSEAELRRQAAAAGKDPDAAVQVAKRRGYQLTK